MNSHHKYYLLLLILTIGLYIPVSAQPLFSSFLTKSVAAVSPIRYRKATNVKSHQIFNVNMKAQRAFVKQFRHAETEEWYTSGENFLVFFSDKGVQSRALISKSGMFIYTIYTVKKENIPDDLMENIRFIYPQYSIRSAYHVCEAQQDFWYLNLQNGGKYKVLYAEQDNIKVIQEFEE